MSVCHEPWPSPRPPAQKQQAGRRWAGRQTGRTGQHHRGRQAGRQAAEHDWGGQGCTTTQHSPLDHVTLLLLLLPPVVHTPAHPPGPVAHTCPPSFGTHTCPPPCGKHLPPPLWYLLIQRLRLLGPPQCHQHPGPTQQQGQALNSATGNSGLSSLGGRGRGVKGSADWGGGEGHGPWVQESRVFWDCR